MSRSTYMLMALAPPAASVPPMTVATISQSDGRPACGHDHRRHRGDEQQLDDARLGERHVRPDSGTERDAQGSCRRCHDGATVERNRRSSTIRPPIVPTPVWMARRPWTYHRRRAAPPPLAAGLSAHHPLRPARAGVHHRHRRRRPADRLRARLLGLADVRAGQVRRSAPVPPDGRVREPVDHRLGVAGRDPGGPRLARPRASPARPHVALGRTRAWASSLRSSSAPSS